MVASEWKLPPRAERCAVCERGFDDQQLIVACIHQTDGGYARIDLCEQCPIPPGIEPLGRWRTRFRLPQREPRPQFDRGGLLELLASTAEAGDEQTCKFRFALALLLWRKKFLRLTTTRRDADRELWQFVETRGGGRHEIVRPELNEDDLARLSAQLEALLWSQPAPSETPAG